MKFTKKQLWIAIIAGFVLLLVASVIIPDLHRTRQFAEQPATAVGSPAPSAGPMNEAIAPMTRARTEVLGGIVDHLEKKAAPEAAPVSFDSTHKIIRTAALDIVVKNVPQAIEQIRREAMQLGGYVEKANLTRDGNDNISGSITVRVPQSHLDQAMSEFKQAAMRVENENIQSNDVTRQFIDTESELRNFRAEEQQYLAIMRTATKVQDTLDVAERLSDVRGRIESLQGQLQYLSHEVEMSTVTLNVRPQITAVAAVFEWHPLVNARAAYREMLSGVAEFTDFIVALVIKLPVVLLWLAFIGATVYAGWRVGKWGYVRAKASLPATATQPTQQ